MPTAARPPSPHRPCGRPRPHVRPAATRPPHERAPHEQGQLRFGATL